jgi:hypothetical protein
LGIELEPRLLEIRIDQGKTRGAQLPEPAALQLTRRQDLLEMPDLAIYEPASGKTARPGEPAACGT